MTPENWSSEQAPINLRLIARVESNMLEVGLTSTKEQAEQAVVENRKYRRR